MKIIEMKNCDGVQIMFWMNGALIGLDDALEILRPRERAVVLNAIAMRRANHTATAASYAQRRAA